MNPETRFTINDAAFFVQLFWRDAIGMKDVNFLWMRERGLSEAEVSRFVDLGFLSVNKETPAPVEEVPEIIEKIPEKVIALQSVKLEKTKGKRGRPRKNAK